MKRHHRLLVLTVAALTLPTGAQAQDMGMSALFTSAQSDSETTTTVPSEKGWASDANSTPSKTSNLSQEEVSEASKDEGTKARSDASSEKQGSADAGRAVAAKSDDDSDAKADSSDSKKSKSSKKGPTAKAKKSKSDAKNKKTGTTTDAKSSDADSKDEKDGDSDKEKDGAKPPKAPKVKKVSKKSDVPWPTRLTSFACCSFLGMPIAMAKSGYKQTLAGNKDLIGDSKNPIKLLISTSLSLPFAMAGGFLEGSGYSVINSWKGSAQEPFGREAFSLDAEKPAAQDLPSPPSPKKQ